MCAGYSRRLATSRSARSSGDPMATAKVRDGLSWARPWSSCTYHFMGWQKYHAAPRKAPLTLGRVTFLLCWSLSACAWEEKADCVLKHTSPMGYVSPHANWCLPSEQGLYIHSRCAIPTPLNRMILSLERAKIGTLHLGSLAPSSTLLMKVFPFFTWSLHGLIPAPDCSCKGTGASLNITLITHLLFETHKYFIAKLGAFPPPATFCYLDNTKDLLLQPRLKNEVSLFCRKVIFSPHKCLDKITSIWTGNPLLLAV